MGTPQHMGFHEATVVRFFRRSAAVELELEDVLVDGQKSRVTLMISPVHSLLVDDKPSHASLMEAADGEILMLEMSENTVSLLIEWNDFSSRRKSWTKYYRVLGGKVSVSVM